MQNIQIFNSYLTESTSCLNMHSENIAVHFQKYTERKYAMWTKCVDFSVKRVRVNYRPIHTFNVYDFLIFEIHRNAFSTSTLLFD